MLSISVEFGSNGVHPCIVDEVVAAVSRWPAVAHAAGIGRGEQGRMARAFRLATLP